MLLSLVMFAIVTGIFLFSASFAEIDEPSVWTAGWCAAIFSVVMWFCGALVYGGLPELPRIAATLLLTACAFLIVQLLSRWFYAADARQAHIMSASVAVGYLLGISFLRWAVS